MDHFGISHAMMAMVDMYRRGARRTGRTTALLDSLRNGDRVLCGDASSLADLRHRIAARGLSVEVLMVSQGDVHRVTEKRSSTGRTILDHTFVEDHFEAAVKRAATEIRVLQDLCSQESERDAIKMADLNRSRFRI